MSNYKPTGELLGNAPNRKELTDSPTNRGGDKDDQPEGTRFVSHGEHVGSEVINRGLSAVSKNVDILNNKLSKSVAASTTATKAMIPELAVGSSTSSLSPTLDEKHPDWDGWVYHGRSADLDQLFKLLDETDGTEVLGGADEDTPLEVTGLSVGGVDPQADAYSDRVIMTTTVSSPSADDDPRHEVQTLQALTHLDWTDSLGDTISPSRQGLHLRIYNSTPRSGNAWERNDGMYVVTHSPDKQTFHLGEFLYRLRLSDISGSSFGVGDTVYVGPLEGTEDATTNLGVVRELGVGTGDCYIEIDPADYTGIPLPEVGEQIHVSGSVEAEVRSIQQPFDPVVLNNKMTTPGSVAVYRDGHFSMINECDFTLNDDLVAGQGYLLTFGRRTSLGDLSPSSLIGASDTGSWIDPSGELEAVMTLDGVYDWAARVTSDPGDGREITVDAGPVLLTAADSADNPVEGLLQLDTAAGDVRKALQVDLDGISSDGDRNRGVVLSMPPGYDSASSSDALPHSAVEVAVPVYGNGNVLAENDVEITYDGTGHLVTFRGAGPVDLTVFEAGAEYSKWPQFSVFLEIYDALDAKSLNGVYHAHSAILGTPLSTQMYLYQVDTGVLVTPDETGASTITCKARFIARPVALYAQQGVTDRVHSLSVSGYSDQAYASRISSRALTALFIERDSADGAAAKRLLWAKSKAGTHVMRLWDEQTGKDFTDYTELSTLFLSDGILQGGSDLTSDGMARIELSEGEFHVRSSLSTEAISTLFRATRASAHVHEYLLGDPGIWGAGKEINLEFGTQWRASVSGATPTLQFDRGSGSTEYLELANSGSNMVVTMGASQRAQLFITGGGTTEDAKIRLTGDAPVIEIVDNNAGGPGFAVIQQNTLSLTGSTLSNVQLNNATTGFTINGGTSFLHLDEGGTTILETSTDGSADTFLRLKSPAGTDSMPSGDKTRVQFPDRFALFAWNDAGTLRHGIGFDYDDVSGDQLTALEVFDSGGSQDTEEDPGAALGLRRPLVKVKDIRFSGVKETWTRVPLTSFDADGTGSTQTWDTSNYYWSLSTVAHRVRALVPPYSEGSRTGSSDVGNIKIVSFDVRWKKVVDTTGGANAGTLNLQLYKVDADGVVSTVGALLLGGHGVAAGTTATDTFSLATPETFVTECKYFVVLSLTNATAELYSLLVKTTSDRLITAV